MLVVVAGLVSGLLAGISLPDLLALLGTSFTDKRPRLMFLLTLPAIGLLAHYGLRERAREWIVSSRFT